MIILFNQKCFVRIEPRRKILKAKHRHLIDVIKQNLTQQIYAEIIDFF